MPFFTPQNCREYAQQINAGLNKKEDHIKIKCKADFGKEGVCFKYVGQKYKNQHKSPYYGKYNCKNSKANNIIEIQDDAIICGVTNGLFNELQYQMKFKDENTFKSTLIQLFKKLDSSKVASCETMASEYFDKVPMLINKLWKTYPADKKDLIHSTLVPYYVSPNDLDYVIFYVNGIFSGVLIVEFNECDKIIKPNNSYSVKLICTQKVESKIPIGLSLLGFYVYVLKTDIKQQRYGLLELAQGYKNVAGFCLYSKLNFVADPKFPCPEYESKYNLNNLKMLVDLKTIEVGKLIQIIRNNQWYDDSMKLKHKDMCIRCETEACRLNQIDKQIQNQTQYEQAIDKVLKQKAGFMSGETNPDFKDWHNHQPTNVLGLTRSISNLSITEEPKKLKKKSKKISLSPKIRLLSRRRSRRNTSHSK